MPSRSTLVACVAASAVLGFTACKTVYSDTFSYRKNSFQPPVVKEPEIKLPPTTPQPLEGIMPGGALPGVPGGIPGVPAPDGGGIPGLPGGAPAAPAIPAVPGTPPAPAPGAPAIPGIN